jgi:glycosyltransferase involved in cell wall biosynthesis
VNIPEPPQVKTLQLFNQYLHYGGEENVVNTLSELGDGQNWADLQFRSADWQAEPWIKKLTQPCRAFYNPQAIRSARDAHHRFAPDVWLAHNLLPVGSIALYHLAKQLRTPIIQYIHNYRPFCLNGTAWHKGKIIAGGFEGNLWPEIMAGTYRQSRLQTLFMALLIKSYFLSGAHQSVAGWIAPTAFQKKKFVQAGIAEDHILTQLPPRTLPPTPEPWNETENFLFLGRLVPEKGVLFLLDHWQTAQNEGRHLPKLTIAGDGPLATTVKQRAASLSQVEYYGLADKQQIRGLLTRCMAVVIPSEWWEVMGLVVFEAYESSKPVLAAKTGGLGEIVFDGISGFQFEPGNHESFHQAIHLLRSKTRGERQSMGTFGRNWLQKETSPEHWKSRYLDFAGQIASRHAKLA